MPDYRIRTATADDIPVLVTLQLRMYGGHIADGLLFPFRCDPDAIRSVLETQLKSRLCLILVAEARDEVFGFVSALITKPERRFTMDGKLGRINDIYVEPDRRGQGAARALLGAAESWMRENEVTLAECDILSRNERGGVFWQSRGYREMAAIYYKYLGDG